MEISTRKMSVGGYNSFDSLFLFSGELDKNILNIIAGNRTETFHSFLMNLAKCKSTSWKPLVCNEMVSSFEGDD